MTWTTTSTLATKDRYALCRCGQSGNKPFCDGTHARVGFDADDVAGGTYDDAPSWSAAMSTCIRPRDLRARRVLRHHGHQCVGRGRQDRRHCGAHAHDRDIEHCPSGALTYQLDGVTNEPLFPQAISVINDGPLWVTAMVPITNSDGTVLESRNRVTFCRCGDSSNKPLCDGSHKEAGFTEP